MQLVAPEPDYNGRADDAGRAAIPAVVVGRKSASPVSASEVAFPDPEEKTPVPGVSGVVSGEFQSCR